MTVAIEMELPMSGQMLSGMQASIDKTTGFEHDLHQHDNFAGPPRADIPSWLMSDENLCLSKSNHQMRDMEAGQSISVTRPGTSMPSSASINCERQAPRRSSRKMIGPTTPLPDEEKIFSHRLSSDLDQTRNIRIALIIGLLVVLLGILICVILTILSCRNCDAETFDEVHH